MRTLLTAIMVAMLVMAFGCSEAVRPIPVVTLLSAPNEFEDAEPGTEYTGRVGLQVGDSELGAAIYCWPEGNDYDELYGVYALQYITDSNSIPLIDRIYLGAQATMDIDGEGGMYGFLVGAEREILGITVVTEFAYRNYQDAMANLYDTSSDEYIAHVGVKIPF